MEGEGEIERERGSEREGDFEEAPDESYQGWKTIQVLDWRGRKREGREKEKAIMVL